MKTIEKILIFLITIFLLSIVGGFILIFLEIWEVEYSDKITKTLATTFGLSLICLIIFGMFNDDINHNEWD